MDGESPRGTVYRFSSAEAETARKKNTMTRVSLFTSGLLPVPAFRPALLRLDSGGKRKSPFAVCTTTNGHVWLVVHPPASRDGIVAASSRITLSV